MGKIKDLTQLMLGNYVMDNDGVIVVIEALTSDNALVIGYGDNGCLFSKKEYPELLFESEIYEIGIDNSWMKDFEFSTIDRFNYISYVKDDVEYIQYEGETNIWCEIINMEVKTVHQLQNLHFELTSCKLIKE